ncbi:MAG: hypothetical protein PHO75_02415 [Candidatus Shapirobacteria bacterium]|nr:hypothetical protein [Candidatus Shapirobacteria bacterium]
MKTIEELIKNKKILVKETKKLKVIYYKVEDIKDNDIDIKIEKYLDDNGFKIVGIGIGSGIKNFTYEKK